VQSFIVALEKKMPSIILIYPEDCAKGYGEKNLSVADHSALMH
jgi:hypothetical protein